MKRLILLIFFFHYINVCSQTDSYTATIVNENNRVVPYAKMKSKGLMFNSDSLGIIRGNLKKGDTITIIDYNLQKSFHVVRDNKEKITVTEKYFEIEPIILKSYKIKTNNYSVQKSKKSSYYSIQYDREYAFLNYSDKRIEFNKIEIPIKFFSDKKNVYNTNTKFSIQFYSTENGIPNNAISEKLYFNFDKNLKKIVLKVDEKISILEGNFFIVLKAYESSSKIVDKSVYRFNPFFLCNLDGKKGSYAEYLYKDEKWKIIDKERNAFIFNLNYSLSYE